MTEPDKNTIRRAIVPGLFYPDDPQKLTELLEERLSAFSPGSAPLILAPHGAYETAGTTMAAAFAACRNRTVRKVLLIGPVHREKEATLLALPRKDFFEIPSGYLPVDREARQKLIESSDLFRLDDIPHREEHCLEVHLPIIKHLFPEARILPLLTGNLNRKQIRRAAESLRKVYNEKKESLLTVLSVNLTDYAPLEKGKPQADHLLDMLDFPLTESLAEEFHTGRITTCGSAVLTLASELYPAAGKGVLLDRSNSINHEKRGEMGVYYGGLCWKET